MKLRPAQLCAFVVTPVLLCVFTTTCIGYGQDLPLRVESGLVIAYDFAEGNGRIIHDRSGSNEPIDLMIETPDSVRWSKGTLTVVSSASIVSPKVAKRLVEAIRKSNALTIETWVTPASTDQTGPARIVSLSSNPGVRNLTLGQDNDVYDVRLKTTSTDGNGNPSTAAPGKSLTAALTHVVFTRDSTGAAVIFVNGKQVVGKSVGGDMSNWETGHRLSLANEISRDRPWLGQFHFVAIYDRALNGDEVQQNFAAGSSHVLRPAASVVQANAPDMSAAATDSEFHKAIQPLLVSKCIKCHGPEKQQGGLRLDQKAAAFKGGDSGEPAIVPGKSMDSRLLKLVTAKDENERMPPEGEPLTGPQIELLKKWIDAGAEWPETDSPTRKPARLEMVVTDEDRNHWSFRALQTMTPPVVVDQACIRNPVDQFVRHTQEAKGLTPAATADARTLIRRVYFDVIGLPPMLIDNGEMLHEQTLGIDIDPVAILSQPTAYSALINQLLTSPHYGERWARHWLDVARYADSDGQEGDADRPNAYRFRDFVIRSLNDDLPYNTFVRWQLAGDEIAPDNPQAIAATGFIVAGNSTVLNVPMEEEKLRNRANELDDMVSTTAQAFLGMTLACARCHDHKYDPLPTRDYYRMMCAFNSGDRTDVPLAAPALVKQRRDDVDTWQEELKAAQKKKDDWLKNLRQPIPIARQVLAQKVMNLVISSKEKNLLLDRPDDPAAEKLAEKFRKELQIEDSDIVAALSTEEQAKWKELHAAVKSIADRKPQSLPIGFAFADFASEPRETWLFERGDFMARNERLSLGFLTVMQRDKSADDYWNAAQDSKLRDDSTLQRHAMADWMTDTEHGAGVLLARVFVNRIWQHHFGDGIVRTVSDFGTRGDAPTHPELLEWLTGEFINHSWSVKHLHRLILNSHTYRQGGAPNAANNTIDPENKLLWRRRPQRLESEILRDSMLTVAGSINSEMFGPGVKPPIPDEAMQARNVKNPYPQNVSDTVETRRRSIYMFHKRVVQYPLMQAFDAPDAQVSCGQRTNTTVAPQALALLNDPFVRLRSEEFAQRLMRETGSDGAAQIRFAFQAGLARQPDNNELTVAQTFLAEQSAARKVHDQQLTDDAAKTLALTDFCQMLFSFNEFIYVD